MPNVKERFLRYVSFDTTSQPDCTEIPSTAKQWDLARLLVEELTLLGVQDVRLSENGYVYGSIPSNLDRAVPAIGFIAHMDTSPDLSGADIHPQEIVNYDGGDIVLNEQKQIIMRVSEFPALAHRKGKTLIVTDGTTLLGGDDKAGVAEIVTLAEYLLTHPEFKHGEVKIGFTPDEEVGNGATKFDVPGFGADFAYTVDGGEAGEIEYENFNAASAKICIHGVNIHPGSAKNKMVNSMRIAIELDGMLPPQERPEYTEGYDGFSHLNDLSGTVEETRMLYIIRDHDRSKFEAKKARFTQIAAYLNGKYGPGVVELTLTDSYYNMKEQILPHFEVVEHAVSAIKEEGLSPIIVPVRGGTDGARLSYMGLPCPNLGTGAQNGHGRYELVCVEEMEASVRILLGILKNAAQA